MSVLHINGVPVRVFSVGGRCVAVIGGDGQRQAVRSSDTLDGVLQKVVSLLRPRGHHVPKSAA